MKAKFTDHKGFNADYNHVEGKACISTLHLLAIRKGEIKWIACVRTFTNAAHVGATSANLVQFNAYGHCAGIGKAGGGGYHRPSTAMQRALENAGIVLDADIAACGYDAMCDALRAVGRLLGYRGKLTIIGD